MFKPRQTTRRFDRNIFNGLEKPTTIKTKKSLQLLFFYNGDIVVGEIKGTVSATLYWKFIRHNFIPVQVWHSGLDYCGWLCLDDFEVIE